LNHVRLLAIAAAVALLFTRRAAGAAPKLVGTQTGFYLAVKPGVSVEYLSLNDTGIEVTGYLEQIVVSGTAPDGQVRTQTFAKRRDGVLTFGPHVLTRVARGYEMTSTSPDGRIEETVFVPVAPRSVNASIVALSTSVNRHRIEIDRLASAAALRTYSAMSADDSRRLARAQLEVASAAAELRRAQLAADRSSALARQARSLANAKIDEAGVSLEQNQSRLSAMNAADAAELNAVVAQRMADVAGTALNASVSNVATLQIHLAQISRMARALATRSSEPAAGR
jgi:multidrug efflux pump subunit AcrA (membrane-fusion protein)